MDNKELVRRIGELQEELDRALKERREYMIESHGGHDRIKKKLKDEKKEVEKVLEQSSEYVGFLIDGVEILSDKLNYAFDSYKKSDKFCGAMKTKFYKGVEVCREQVVARYTGLDLGWLDGLGGISDGNESSEGGSGNVVISVGEALKQNN